MYSSYSSRYLFYQFIHELGRIALWYGYWVLLGIASAFGLGTGLHTFLLFLGPYIAEVTRDAYQCQGADFLVRDPTTYVLFMGGMMVVDRV